MKAYSQDLRERVLRAADQGMAHQEIVKVLGVSLATIGRYLKQRRETGQVRAKAIPGRPSKKMASLQAGLVAQLQRFPDATLQQHAQYWEQRQGMQVSRWTVGRTIKRMGVTRKKTRTAFFSGMATRRHFSKNTARAKPFELQAIQMHPSYAQGQKP
jgi:transposase